MLLRMLWALVSTAVRRLVHGPLLPSWGFLFEVSVAFLRNTARLTATLDLAGERKVWSGMKAPRAKVMDLVRETELECNGVRARWFEPRTGDADLVIVYAHGGSFVFGSIDSHAELTARLALAAQARVLSLDYRLAPEHPFPAAREDFCRVLDWVFEQGILRDRLLVAGDSAGANLAVTSLLFCRERGAPMPAGAILICPWTDLSRQGGTMTSHERYDWGVLERFPVWAKAYAAELDPKHPALSPAFADLRGLPPLLVLAGDREMSLDQVNDFVRAAERDAVSVRYHVHPEMIHAWLTLHDYTPEAPRAFAEIRDFTADIRKR